MPAFLKMMVCLLHIFLILLSSCGISASNLNNNNNNNNNNHSEIDLHQTNNNESKEDLDVSGPLKDASIKNTPNNMNPFSNKPHIPISILKSVGFRNRSNYCYMNAMLTAFYHLLGPREHIMLKESNNMLMTALMHTFYQLNRRVSTQDVEEVLLPIMKQFGIENSVEPGKADDAAAFWQFLINNLPSLDKEFFTMKIENKYFIEKELVSSHTTPNTYFIAPTLDGSKKYIDEYLQPSKADNIEYLSSSLPNDFKERLQVKYNQGLPDKFIAEGETQITVWPSILPIAGGVFESAIVSKGFYNNQGDWVPPRAISGPISPEKKFLFRRTFEVQDQNQKKTYHLVSYVIYKHPNHFVCRALTNIRQDLWSEFNDNQVTEVEWDKYESSEQEKSSYPYLLFYVEDSIFTEWKDKVEIKASTINILYSQSLQLMVDAIKTWQKVLPQQGIERPGLDNIKPPSAEEISEPKQAASLAV